MKRTTHVHPHKKPSDGLKRRLELRLKRRIASPDYGYPESEARYANFKEYCRDPRR